MSSTSRYFILLTSFVSILSTSPLTGQISAIDIINNSIRFHDPKGNWSRKPINLTLREVRPGAADRITDLTINNRKNSFKLEQTREGHVIKYVVNKKGTKILLDGKVPSDTSLLSHFRLNKDRVATIRNFYLYLYGLPMKIRDPGAIISDTYTETTFADQESLRIRMTYSPEVGNDIWYLYFNPNNYQLIGYQFYHDQSKNDGEYITLEGVIEIGGIKFPQKRSWFTNSDHEFLGHDTIER